MLPASAVAAALLLSLVPGWMFLRLTERARRPRHQSDLQEVLELVSVGVLTTGVAALLAALFRPAGLLTLELPPQDDRDLRELAGSALGLFALALILSWLFALIVNKSSSARQASLVTSVWWDVLRADRVPPGKVPYALVTMTDDKTVEGVLEAYTWQSDSSHYRDIALRSPIRYPAGKGTYKKTGYDHLVIAGSDIKQIAVQYTVM